MLVRAKCEWCSAVFEYNRTRKFRAYCSDECRKAGSAANRIRYVHNCKGCGFEFTSYRKSVTFCSAKCANSHRERMVHRDSNGNAGKLIVCRACGETKPARRDAKYFCSRRCSYAWARANAMLRVIDLDATKSNHCECCGKEILKASRMCVACRKHDKAYHNLERREYRCQRCRLWFHKSIKIRHKKYCEGCQKEAASLKAKERKSSDKGREAMRKARKNRKHKLREAKANNPSFSDLALFSRDRWKCQLCGRKVRKIAGVINFDDEATVDHIIPLSRGGKHSMANCQTTCRACNTLKGASLGWTPGSVQSTTHTGGG